MVFLDSFGRCWDMEMKAVSAQVVSCCVYDKSKQNKPHLHGMIPYMFDNWAYPVVHLYLLNSFIPDLIRRTKSRHGLISKVSCHHNQNGKKWKCNLCKLQNSQALQKQSSQILTRYFKLQSPWETHMSRQVQIMLKISRKVLIAQPTYLSVCLFFVGT